MLLEDPNQILERFALAEKVCLHTGHRKRTTYIGFISIQLETFQLH